MQSKTMFGDLPRHHFGANETFLNGKVTLHHGNCLDVLKQLQENNIDSCVTDPPYHLTSIVKRFANENPWDVEANFEARKLSSQGASPFARTARGFMGKQWDGGDIAFRSEIWVKVLRVLKPGAHLLAFGGTRTYHRMACAIEDAGFEIRDCIQWLYGNGFPKSHDVSKGIDKAAGAERERIGTKVELGIRHNPGRENETSPLWAKPHRDNPDADAHWVTCPATDAARQWEGWGTALKPACELIVLARKPLSEPTVAANVLKWGTGAINVDGCRVGFVGDTDEQESKAKNQHSNFGSVPRHNQIYGKDERPQANYNPPGRWPANVIHDGSEEVVAAFPETSSGARNGQGETYVSNSRSGGPLYGGACEANSGSAARFFYTAKADSDDRIGSKHPTVKPLDLMQYLVRLITPPRGVCLDPFAGTGMTGEAAWREGMHAVLIERETEYQADIRRRMALALAGPNERVRESIKAKNLPRDDGPLFAFAESQYDGADDFERSIDECYRAVRERKAAGGKGWPE